MAAHHDAFKRENAGINTVEGNVAGARAARLSKKREEEQKEYEAKKQKIQDDFARGAVSISDKFGGASSDVFDGSFRMDTVGLVTAEDYKKKRLAAESGLAPGADGDSGSAAKAKKKGAKKKRKKKVGTLSFGEDEDEGETEVVKKGKKNPFVDTSFLPDREREDQFEREKKKLEEEWHAEQERIKKEMLGITYSYWDGSGHRREIEVCKGTTVGKFLTEVQKQISQEFTELRSISGDQLLYIKEDLIIPQHLSFYDLIVTKARGKSGPLFHFDVHDDVRLINDATVEKDESHPGKIVERRWYERSKHIFPASRWEIYDPKKDYGGYSIHGGEINHKK